MKNISEEQHEDNIGRDHWNPNELGFSFDNIFGNGEGNDFIVGPMVYYNKKRNIFESDWQININDKEINKLCYQEAEGLYSFNTKKISQKKLEKLLISKGMTKTTCKQ